MLHGIRSERLLTREHSHQDLRLPFSSALRSSLSNNINSQSRTGHACSATTATRAVWSPSNRIGSSSTNSQFFRFFFTFPFGVEGAMDFRCMNPSCNINQAFLASRIHIASRAMYDSSPISSVRFCSRLAFHSEILPYSGSARPRLLGEFVRTNDISRRIAAAVAWGEGNWGNFWFCLIVALVGVDGSNASLSLSLLLSWNSRGGSGGYNAIQRSCLICHLASKVGMIIPYSMIRESKGSSLRRFKLWWAKLFKHRYSGFVLPFFEAGIN